MLINIFGHSTASVSHVSIVFRVSCLSVLLLLWTFVSGVVDFAMLGRLTEGWIDAGYDVMVVVSNVGSWRWVGGRALCWGHNLYKSEAQGRRQPPVPWISGISSPIPLTPSVRVWLRRPIRRRCQCFALWDAVSMVTPAPTACARSATRNTCRDNREGGDPAPRERKLLHHRQDHQDQLVWLWRTQPQSPAQRWQEPRLRNKQPVPALPAL